MVVKREDCDLRMAFQLCFLRNLRDPIEDGVLPEDGVLLVLGAVHALDGLNGRVSVRVLVPLNGSNR